jgi:hypothetical protein
VNFQMDTSRKVVAVFALAGALAPTAGLWWVFHRNLGHDLWPILVIVFVAIVACVPLMYCLGRPGGPTVFANPGPNAIVNLN